jgi:hypothetical protein
VSPLSASAGAGASSGGRSGTSISGAGWHAGGAVPLLGGTAGSPSGGVVTAAGGAAQTTGGAGATADGGATAAGSAAQTTGGAGATADGGATAAGSAAQTTGGAGATADGGATAAGGAAQTTGGAGATAGGSATSSGGTSAAAGGASATTGGASATTGGASGATSNASGGSAATSGGQAGANSGGNWGGATTRLNGGTSGSISPGGTSSIDRGGGGGSSASAGFAGGAGSPFTGGSAGAGLGAGAGAGGASPPGGLCSWASRPPLFGAPVSLGTPNTTAPEIDPVLSRDGLSLYFVSYRDSLRGNDIYVATRTSTSSGFGAGVLLTAANSASNDTHFFVAPNDLEAFISSDRTPTTGGVDILGATRTSPAATWGSFTTVANINSVGGDFDPHLESDQLTLWFDPVGRSNGSGQQDLFFAIRSAPSSAFGTPTPASSLNSPADEWDVSLTDDSRVIVFQSNRDSARHVYYALRPNRGVAFHAPAIITALDPYIATLSDPFVAPDGCSIYFAANFGTGAGSQDLYRVEAAPGH